MGYLYSFDYSNNKVIWAKNYKLPFKSNLKISNDKIMVSDVNNNLIYFNKKNGEIFKKIPTENTTFTSKFINNISKHDRNLFFLNSYGSLYSSDVETANLNWFVNLNSSSNRQIELFDGSNIVTNGNRVIVSSSRNTYIIDSKTGTIIKKYNFSSLLTPIINDNICFFLSKNNFLIAIDLENNEILYSQDINLKVANFLDTKKKSLNFKTMMLLNSEIFIFLNNSYVLNFQISGDLKK